MVLVERVALVYALNAGTIQLLGYAKTGFDIALTMRTTTLRGMKRGLCASNPEAESCRH